MTTDQTARIIQQLRDHARAWLAVVRARPALESAHECAELEMLFSDAAEALAILRCELEEAYRRTGCWCKCCDHGEGSDCGCDCHVNGLCSHDPIGTLRLRADAAERARDEAIARCTELEEVLRQAIRELEWCGADTAAHAAGDILLAASRDGAV